MDNHASRRHCAVKKTKIAQDKIPNLFRLKILENGIKLLQNISSNSNKKQTTTDTSIANVETLKKNYKH